MQKCEHPIPVRFQFFLINLYLILKVANSNYRHGFRIGLKLKEVEAFGFSTILLVNDLGQSECNISEKMKKFPSRKPASDFFNFAKLARPNIVSSSC